MMNRSDDCIFCKIIAGELPSAKLYEDDDHIAILDLFPVTKGHTLLIPKKHYINLLDADENIALSVYPTLKKIANALKKTVNYDGLNIIQNNGADAGQVVFHSHIHLIPRYSGDDLHLAVAGKSKAEYEVLNTLAQEASKYF